MTEKSAPGGHGPDPKDLPRQELMDLADKTISDYRQKGLDAFVHFKFTCTACGERCTLAETNTLRESGECFRCNAVTPIEKGGFVLIYRT